MVALTRTSQSSTGRAPVDRQIGSAVVAGLALALLAGCSGSGSEPASTPSASNASSPTSSSPAVDPEVQKAIDAYEAFDRASNKALENPVEKGESLTQEADFRKWSFDPVESETIVFLHVLASYDAEFRGSEPQSHVKVDEVSLNGSPYPLVKLIDCHVPQGLFVPYNRETGKRLKLAGAQDLEEPYRSDIEVINVKGRWGVRSAVAQHEAHVSPEVGDRGLPDVLGSARKRCNGGCQRASRRQRGSDMLRKLALLHCGRSIQGSRTAQGGFARWGQLQGGRSAHKKPKYISRSL